MSLQHDQNINILQMFLAISCLDVPLEVQKYFHRKSTMCHCGLYSNCIRGSNSSPLAIFFSSGKQTFQLVLSCSTSVAKLPLQEKVKTAFY